MIYLDNAATTKIAPEVLEAMLPYLTEEYGNPSAQYSLAWSAKEAVEKARLQVAKEINAESNQIFFTSGATESNNWVYHICKEYCALKHGYGCSSFLKSDIEHHSVSGTMYTDAWRYGTIFERCLDIDTRNDELHFDLVSHMMVNNETGEIFNIKTMVNMCHNRGTYVLFHADATQAIGHMPVDVKDLDIDFLSLSGHKFHAPKGVGVLYIKEPEKYKPMLLGGGQERGMRAGTENVASIVGLGRAIELFGYKKDVQDKIQILSNKLRSKIAEKQGDRFLDLSSFEEKTCFESLRLPKSQIATILNFCFKGISGEALQIYLETQDICVSTGSACNSGSETTSHVLKTMGVPEEYIKGSIRISLSEYTTEEEIDCVAKAITEYVDKWGKI